VGICIHMAALGEMRMIKNKGIDRDGDNESNSTKFTRLEDAIAATPTRMTHTGLTPDVGAGFPLVRSVPYGVCISLYSVRHKE
jgi:hypothetical protein